MFQSPQSSSPPSRERIFAIIERALNAQAEHQATDRRYHEEVLQRLDALNENVSRLADSIGAAIHRN